jgi:hypothetical protein
MRSWNSDTAIAPEGAPTGVCRSRRWFRGRPALALAGLSLLALALPVRADVDPAMLQRFAQLRAEAGRGQSAAA